jgi:hypothetical protein
MKFASPSRVSGEWTSGPNAGLRAAIFDIRAGMLYTVGPDRTQIIGAPDDFRAGTGESGDTLMERLLPWPNRSALFHGAIREALADAHSVAMVGQQDTRAWDRRDCYIVDNNEGDTGAVRFLLGACIGAVSSHDPTRPFDHITAIVAAPSELQEDLSSLCMLPLFDFGGRPRITAVFWSDGDSLCGPEPWHISYQYGGELFRRELLSDELWQEEAAEHYELIMAITTMIIGIAKRATPRQLIMLTEEESTILFPKDSDYHNEAIEQLVNGNVFGLP